MKVQLKPVSLIRFLTQLVLLPAASDGNQAKRVRVHSGSADTAEVLLENQLPEGMPDVVSEGFVNIPAPPVGTKGAAEARGTKVTQGEVS